MVDEVESMPEIPKCLQLLKKNFEIKKANLSMRVNKTIEAQCWSGSHQIKQSIPENRKLVVRESVKRLHLKKAEHSSPDTHESYVKRQQHTSPKVKKCSRSTQVLRYLSSVSQKNKLPSLNYLRLIRLAKGKSTKYDCVVKHIDVSLHRRTFNCSYSLRKSIRSPSSLAQRSEDDLTQREKKRDD